jgi:hypothetical protein
MVFFLFVGMLNQEQSGNPGPWAETGRQDRLKSLLQARLKSQKAENEF